VLLSAGQLDPSFGVSGTVQTAIDANPTFDEVNAVTTEPGGKIIAVGTSLESVDDPKWGLALPPNKTSYNFAVARYLPDGQPDPTFGYLVGNNIPADLPGASPGTLITDFSGGSRSSTTVADSNDYAYGVVVLPNSDILVAGITLSGALNGFNTPVVCVAVYNFQGVLESEFISTNPLNTFGSMSYNQTTKTLTIVGSSQYETTDSDFQIYRYSVVPRTATVSVDGAFNGGALAIPFQSYSADFATSVAENSDGSLIVGGFSDTSTYNQITGHKEFVVLKVSNLGVLDSSFEDVIDFGGTDAEATSLAIQSDGKILVAGYGDNEGQILRLQANGTLDDTFGGRGIVPLGNIVPTNIFVQPNGRIVVTGGNSFNTVTYNPFLDDETEANPPQPNPQPSADAYFVADRLTSNGVLDTTFGNGGTATVSLSNYIEASSAVYQPLYGKIIIGGTTVTGNLGSGGETNGYAFGIYGDFTLAQLTGDSLAPTAELAANDIDTEGATSLTFTVTYRDAVEMDAATLGSGNIQVTEPTLGYSQDATFVSASPAVNSPEIIATYSITPPGGSVTASDNGTYTVSVLPNQVADTSGFYVAAQNLGAFVIAVGQAQPVLPTASLSAPAITGYSGGSSYTFTVTYTDPVNLINVSTLGNGNVLVTGPGLYSQLATLVSASTEINSNTVVATYNIPAPGGSFLSTGNGAYTVVMQPAQVSDVPSVTGASPDYVTPGDLGTFVVELSAPPATGGTTNNSAPTAVLNPVSTITTPVDTITFSVTYTDTGSALQAATLANNNAAIIVTAPNGTTYAATYISIDNDSNGSPRTVTYQITSPAGAFAPGDSGTYTVDLVNDQIEDATGAFITGGAIGDFTINIPTYNVSPTGLLAINGTNAADSIFVDVVGSQYRVIFNNDQTDYPTNTINAILVNGLAGNDTITIDPSVTIPATINGGVGDDTLSAGGGTIGDLLAGGPGNDNLIGGTGADTLRGGQGADSIVAGSGNDMLFGGQGDDTLVGGTGVDTLQAGAGNNLYYGNANALATQYNAVNGSQDTLNAGGGYNNAFIDFDDVLVGTFQQTTMETFLG
jgi:uncharacterized delta-60 repeat protein